MKKIFLLSVILILFITELDAQRRNGKIKRRKATVGTIVATFGPAYCFGDSKDSPFSKTFLDGTNADFSLGFRYKLPNNFAYKATILYGSYTGTENESSRGLDFNSQILQFNVRTEYTYTFGFGRVRRFKPNLVYGFLGAGIANTNSVHKFDDKLTKDELDKKYVDIKTTDFTGMIPYGFGYQYDFNNNFLLGGEIGWQFPLSDFLDGLHPNSGTSKSNDLLFGVSVTLAYKIL